MTIAEGRRNEQNAFVVHKILTIEQRSDSSGERGTFHFLKPNMTEEY